MDIFLFRLTFLPLGYKTATFCVSTLYHIGYSNVLSFRFHKQQRKFLPFKPILYVDTTVLVKDSIVFFLSKKNFKIISDLKL